MNAAIAALTNSTTGLQAQAGTFVGGTAGEFVGAAVVMAVLALAVRYARRIIR